MKDKMSDLNRLVQHGTNQTTISCLEHEKQNSDVLVHIISISYWAKFKENQTGYVGNIGENLLAIIKCSQ